MNELTETKNNLVYIEVERLHPHPDNPRKELGDLTELSESIKSKGIMQNLTVVPREDGDYTVIIGHRRMAAAKLAGLTELPCVITEMSEQDQVATMLLENMQRSDLTVYEQAQGFQMMFDFGIPIESISEKTGFSKSTVRRRLKMAELNQDTLKKVSKRQLSLTDFDRLYEIENPDKRNEVLSLMGTNNFENALKKTLDEQKRLLQEKKLREVIISNGIREMKSDERTRYCGMAKYMRAPEDTTVIDALLEEKSKYRFEISYGTAYFYQKCGETEESHERNRREQERRRRTAVLSDAAERAFELRKTFVAELSNSDAKAHIKESIEFVIRRWWNPRLYGTYDQNLYAELLGVDVDGKAKSPELVLPETSQRPEYAMLCFAYSMWDDSGNASYHDYEGKHRENFRLDSIYDFLKSLGYEMSDEELALQNGTSELFLKEAPEVELIEDGDGNDE